MRFMQQRTLVTLNVKHNKKNLVKLFSDSELLYYFVPLSKFVQMQALEINSNKQSLRATNSDVVTCAKDVYYTSVC